MELRLEKTKSAERHRLAYEKVVKDPDFQKWFEGSKIIDKEGKPQVLYHATVYDFDSFDPKRGQFGNHFGSLEQAEENVETNKVEIQKFIPLFVCIKKPFYYPSDLPSWKDVELVKKALLVHSKNDAKLHSYFSNNGERIKTIAEIKNILERFGYDGIVYWNMFEGSGENSFITFNKGQTWSLYANKPM